MHSSNTGSTTSVSTSTPSTSATVATTTGTSTGHSTRPAPAIRPSLLLASLLGITFFVTFVQAHAPSLDVDGIHYAAVAKEIALTGRWLLPLDPVNGGPYYWHFPMSVWPTALLFQWFGINVLTAKLFAMSTLLVVAWGLFAWGRELVSPWAGWCAGMAFVFTDHVLRIARQCRPDIPLIACIVWACLALQYAQSRSRWWYLLYGAATCMAIMIKDVVGLSLFAMALGYLLLAGRWRELFHPLFLAGLVVAIAPVVGWIALENAIYNASLADHFYRLNLRHLASSPSFTMPGYYYLWAIWDKYWHWLPLALAGAMYAWGAVRRGARGWILIFIWAIIFPVAFSLTKKKIHYYILPTYAATAIFVGMACDRWVRGVWRMRVVGTLTVLATVASLVLVIAPVPVHRARYAKNVAMAPQIDGLLQRRPGEVLITGEDRASLIFYSREIRSLTLYRLSAYLHMLDKEPPAQGQRYYLLSHDAWDQMDPTLQARWDMVLNDGTRYFLRERSL
jgi:4-amino-4-deoxy-L-arabinose transferase-like glycosyltransferase